MGYSNSILHNQSITANFVKGQTFYVMYRHQTGKQICYPVEEYYSLYVITYTLQTAGRPHHRFFTPDWRHKGIPAHVTDDELS